MLSTLRELPRPWPCRRLAEAPHTDEAPAQAGAVQDGAARTGGAQEGPVQAGARPGRRRRQDRVAIGVLAALPALVFVLPALAGHPVLPGDDLTQNFPLRVLAGSQLRHGHLPLYNPYLWSGSPLLGGWNAGAAYPLTFLFAVLPGVAAWTANMTVTWWAAGLGTFAFLRASRLSPVASFLGALSFAFAGAMTAQTPHFGLVAGMSWVPVALLASLRLAQRPAARDRLLWACALAGAVGLVILAAEPRAIDDAVIIIASYAAWRAWRLGEWRQGAAYFAAVVAALALGVALGAVQWLPGLEAVHSSQRVALTTAVFDSGSLPRKWLLLSLVPDLLGGSGSFGQPSFFANYNLTEVTGYAGLMPLVAACALLGKLRRGPLPDWIIWHAVAVLGVFLALGGNTALGQVLIHVPFYGDQRLQSRNLVIADLALAVLLAYWADSWLTERRATARPSWPGRLLGALPGVAVAGAAAVTLSWRAPMLRWLGLSAANAAAHAGPLGPWLVPSLVLGVLAAALAWWGPRLAPRQRARALVGYVAADIVMFTLLAVLLVAPGLGRGTPRPGQPARKPAASAGPAVPVGRFTHGGRFAVYDPGLADSGELAALRVPDFNVMTGTPSVQGYGSIVDATYAAGTGSHQATGEGQNVLSPQAIGNGTLDQLDTRALLVPAIYWKGPLRDLLVPPRWKFAGFDGSFAVFSDRLAKPPLSLRALPGRTAASASIHATAGPGFAPSRARVSSPHGITIIRAVADIPGWTATWRPDGNGAAKTLPVRRSGLVQSVTVPAGRGTIAWRYAPASAREGLWVSLGALAALLAALLGAGLAAGNPGRRTDRNA